MLHIILILAVVLYGYMEYGKNADLNANLLSVQMALKFEIAG